MWEIGLLLVTGPGDPGTVEALRAACSDPSPQVRRRAARQAVAEIQSRLGGASPGQLSLADAEAGQLSLATDPTGQLSLPEEP